MQINRKKNNKSKKQSSNQLTNTLYKINFNLARSIEQRKKNKQLSKVSNIQSMYINDTEKKKIFTNSIFDIAAHTNTCTTGLQSYCSINDE